MSKMRVYLVEDGPKGQLGSIKELDPVTVTAEGDLAKKAGRQALTDMGFTVRSISWGLNTRGGVDLLAYVMKGAANAP